MYRRTMLNYGLLAAGTVVFAGCEAAHNESPGAATKNAPTLPLGGEPPDRRLIHGLLDELQRRFEVIGEAVSTHLLPPLNETALRRLCAWFPGQISEEIFALYSWRGGQESRENIAPFWFRDVIFITPEQAEVEYRSMMATYGAMLTPEAIGVDLAQCFPFAAFNGGWYVFPCAGQAIDLVHPRPIVSVFQDVGAYYFSLEAMVRTCIDWVSHPKYKDWAGGWEHIEMEIWDRHNPGVF